MSRHILIVDDEPSIWEFLQDILGMEGYETTEAADGLEALDRMTDHRPALVILDLLMPRMNGS
jgi:two-component system response regulator MprA